MGSHVLSAMLSELKRYNVSCCYASMRLAQIHYHFTELLVLISRLLMMSRERSREMMAGLTLVLRRRCAAVSNDLILQV